MNNPLISIIVPVFNCEKYIRECLISLINQTYSNLEIIVINDGSNDLSAQKINEFCKHDKRFKLVNKKNEGVAKTRNIGVQMAKGEYITFVDGDDYISINFIEEALNLVKKYNLDFILGGTRKFNKNSYKDYVVDSKNGILIYDKKLMDYKAKVLSNGKVDDKRLNSCFTSGPVCKLFKSDIVKRYKFNETLVTGEDVVYNLQILESVNKIGIVESIWYFYRQNSQSVTNLYNPKIKTAYEKTLIVLNDMFKKDKEMEKYLKVRAIQQFHGMLLLYPLHSESKLSYRNKKNFINSCLHSTPWKDIFFSNKKSIIPASFFDKLLYLCCIMNFVDIIIFIVKIRLKIKNRKVG